MEAKCKTVLNKVKDFLDDDDLYDGLLDELDNDITKEKEIDEYLLNKDVYERSKSIIDDISFTNQIKNIKNDIISDTDSMPKKSARKAAIKKFRGT